MEAAGPPVRLAADHEKAANLADIPVDTRNQGIEALKDIVYGSVSWHPSVVRLRVL